MEAAREGGVIEAIVHLNQEAVGVKVETFVKPDYLELVQVTPLSADGSPLDESTFDSALQFPDRWRVSADEAGLTSAWYAGKGEWDGLGSYPVLRFQWRVVAPLPGEVTIPFVVTAVDASGQATTETIYGIVGPHASEPKIDAVAPLSVYNGADATLTIQGSDFVETPKVYLRAGSDNFELADVVLLGDETGEVQLLQATILAGTKAGIYKLVVENPDGSSVEYESLEVTDQTIYGLTVVPPAGGLRGGGGATVTGSFEIVNEGNTTDAFDITVAGNVWPVDVTYTTGPVEAGEGTHVLVSVTIPAGTALGESDSATITVTSQGDPTQTITFTLVTTADEFKVYLPFAVR